MEPEPTADAEVAAELGERMLVEQVAALVTPELIEEHRRNPVGLHSLELERVLRHLRRRPLAGKHVLVCTRRDEEWAIGTLSGVRGIGPRILDDERFTTLAEAQHAVFRRRLAALGVELGDAAR